MPFSELKEFAAKEKLEIIFSAPVQGGTVNNPSVQTMAKIAKGLGVSIEELIK